VRFSDEQRRSAKVYFVQERVARIASDFTWGLWFLGNGYSVMNYDRVCSRSSATPLVHARRAYMIHVESPDRPSSSTDKVKSNFLFAESL